MQLRMKNSMEVSDTNLLYLPVVVKKLWEIEGMRREWIRGNAEDGKKYKAVFVI